jgi:predicted RNase H-like HicB family nuclease
MRQVIVYPGEDGYWVAECPSLPGCISQGETRSEVIANMREAIEGYVLALLKKTSCRFQRSVLKRCWWLYEQATPDLRPGMC